MSATAKNRQKVTKEFDFPLTEKDEAAKAKEVGVITGELRQLEQEQKESNASFATKIKERYAKLDEIGSTMRNGKETRVVEAEMEKDFVTATKRFLFQGRVILEEAMTASELQMELSDTTADEDPKPNSREDLGYGKGKIKKGRRPAKTAADGRLEDAMKARASKRKPKDIATIGDVIKSETSKRTKRSTVDGVYKD